MIPDINKRPGLIARLRTASWRDLLVVGLPTLLVAGAAVAVAVKAARFAPPKTIRFVSGPDGSGYRNQAEKYQKILARDGVKLEILPSRGALDNLDKLANPAAKVDVGFGRHGVRSMRGERIVGELLHGAEGLWGQSACAVADGAWKDTGSRGNAAH